MFILPCIAAPQLVKRGVYTIEDLNLSPNIIHTIENTSFNERLYILIFDSNQNALQSIRLWPQSQKYNLVPLQSGYKIVITGDGNLIID